MNFKEITYLREKKLARKKEHLAPAAAVKKPVYCRISASYIPIWIASNVQGTDVASVMVRDELAVCVQVVEELDEP